MRGKTAELTSYSNIVQPLHIATSSNWNILLVALIQAALPSPGLDDVKMVSIFGQRCVNPPHCVKIVIDVCDLQKFQIGIFVFELSTCCSLSTLS